MDIAEKCPQCGGSFESVKTCCPDWIKVRCYSRNLWLPPKKRKRSLCVYV